jgi:hypothetical protein
MAAKHNSPSAGWVVHDSNPEPTSAQSHPSTTQANSTPDERWIVILVEELELSFRELARECGRLTRLVQPRKKCGFPAEGFNYLIAQRMEEMHSAFQIYIRRREHLLSYIKATAWLGRKAQTAADRTAHFSGEFADQIPLHEAGDVKSNADFSMLHNRAVMDEHD